MKIVQSLLLVALLALGFVACKETTKQEPTAENTAVVVDSVMVASKTELTKTINELQNSVDAKIAEVQKQLDSASEDVKAGINAQLDTLRKQRSDLDNLARKVSEATADTWAQIETEVATAIGDIKVEFNK
jgi:hypothetical protein